jgi:D-alanyl-D-alanine carboxypeptidase
MQQNAYKYGFNNSYQKWKQIDWYAVEPWHWRYVGIDFATYLWEKNISFWEFYNNYILKK